MNTKEQLEVVARHAGWAASDRGDDHWVVTVGRNGGTVLMNPGRIQSSDSWSYSTLCPVWQNVRDELKAIRDKAGTATISDPDYLNVAQAREHIVVCTFSLASGTLSDLLLALANAILWIENTKNQNNDTLPLHRR